MKLANAYDFVTDASIFPDGLVTIVGERGENYQEVKRALIKNPKIQAINVLDSESVFQVQKVIDGLVQTGQNTIIIIAH